MNVSSLDGRHAFVTAGSRGIGEVTDAASNRRAEEAVRVAFGPVRCREHEATHVVLTR